MHWEMVMGLEVHLQLATHSKIFSVLFHAVWRRGEYAHKSTRYGASWHVTRAESRSRHAGYCFRTGYRR